jgi:chromate transporter
MVLAMVGVMLPSSILTFSTARWVQANQFSAKVIAFKQGLAPLVIGAILATSWLISATNASWQDDWPFWLCTVISVLLVWKTKVHILWLLLIGAILGAFGLI